MCPYTYKPTRAHENCTSFIRIPCKKKNVLHRIKKEETIRSLIICA